MRGQTAKQGYKGYCESCEKQMNKLYTKEIKEHKKLCKMLNHEQLNQFIKYEEAVRKSGVYFDGLGIN